MTYRTIFCFAWAFVSCVACFGADFNRTSLPIPQQPFGGKIGLTPADSVKDFPAEVTAPEEAPNVLIILTDDVGFGASSTFRPTGQVGVIALEITTHPSPRKGAMSRSRRL